MYFVPHHIKKHILRGWSTLSDAELDDLATVVTARARFCKDAFSPSLSAHDLEVGVGGLTFWHHANILFFKTLSPNDFSIHS